MTERVRAVGWWQRGAIGEFVRFGVAGAFGLIVGFGLYELTYALLPMTQRRATVAWVVSYMAGVAIQHYLHRRFVFSALIGFWASLWRTYVIYSAGSVVAVVANAALVATTSVHHRLIWLITTGLVSVLNFLALRWSTYRER